VSAARFSRPRSPSKAAMRPYGKLASGVLLLGWFCLSSAVVAAQSHDADVAIVVHPDTPVSNLTLAEVRKVFLGERQYWNANIPVVLLIRAPVARERDVVLKTIYQMSESQFKQYWIAKIFRAESATAPKVVYSNDMASELAAAIPGAIAFIQVREVRPGTKVIRVDGHLPGEPGYPLR
jgi:ABC-type phosphate transport system substrate-binding protein